jgi:hypothetical protein
VGNIAGNGGRGADITLAPGGGGLGVNGGRAGDFTVQGASGGVGSGGTGRSGSNVYLNAGAGGDGLGGATAGEGGVVAITGGAGGFSLAGNGANGNVTIDAQEANWPSAVPGSIIVGGASINCPVQIGQSGATFNGRVTFPQGFTVPFAAALPVGVPPEATLFVRTGDPGIDYSTLYVALGNGAVPTWKPVVTGPFPPRLTTAQRVGGFLPAVTDGDLVYDTDLSMLFEWRASAWVEV